MIGLKVWGDFACITNPALKVERVSYDTLTPSAAKGIFRSIYWKPEFEWVIRRIHVINPIRFTSMTRKELMRNGPIDQCLEGKTHTLRSSRLLVNPMYYIEAEIVLNPYRRNTRHATAAAYEQEAVKRMSVGQQFRQPFFGMTGFPVTWEMIPAGDPIPAAIDVTRDLGAMLFDMIPEDIHKDQFKPMFYRAQMDHGVITVPRNLTDDYLAQVFKARDKAHVNKEVPNAA
jgi:CRISPR-associated protein Cas5d